MPPERRAQIEVLRRQRVAAARLPRSRACRSRRSRASRSEPASAAGARGSRNRRRVATSVVHPAGCSISMPRSSAVTENPAIASPANACSARAVSVESFVHVAIDDHPRRVRPYRSVSAPDEAHKKPCVEGVYREWRTLYEWPRERSCCDAGRGSVGPARTSWQEYPFNNPFIGTGHIWTNTSISTN